MTFYQQKPSCFCWQFLYNSIPLACDLLRDNTYFCGTVRFNRHGFPSSLKPTRADVKALRKRESKFCRHGNLLASVWKDTKLVHFLSTQSNPAGEHTVNWKAKGRNKRSNSYSSRYCWLQQKHGWSGSEWATMPILCRGQKVSQVVALPSFVLHWCEHSQCSHSRVSGRQSSLKNPVEI